MKRTLIASTLFLVLAGAFYFVGSTSHLAIFPCEKAVYDFGTHRRAPSVSGVCDLLEVAESGQQASDRVELKQSVYVVEGGVFVLLPLAIALFVASRFRSRPAVPPAPVSGFIQGA